MEIDGVDQQAAGEIPEGDVADQAPDQILQRLAAVEGGGHQPAKGDVGPGDLEDVPPAHGPGPGLHLPQRNAGGPRRPDQRPDARPHDQARHQPPLLQRAEHADVSEPFEAAATEDQGKGLFRVHSLAPAKVTGVTYGPHEVARIVRWYAVMGVQCKAVQLARVIPVTSRAMNGVKGEK